MAGTKISDDMGTNMDTATSGTKIGNGMGTSSKGKTVTKVGDIVITNGGTEPDNDIDFPGEF